MEPEKETACAETIAKGLLRTEILNQFAPEGNLKVVKIRQERQGVECARTDRPH